MCANTNPCEKPGNAFCLSIFTNAANTYDRIKRPTPNLPHAVVVAENA
jgi:hypothetical protein